MKKPQRQGPSDYEVAKFELANRLFFRLYQCANMLHKTGSRAVENEGLSTQRWAVLGALSRPHVAGGMSVGDLARYLMVSRQNLSGLISRMERDGHLTITSDGEDRRSRLARMTDSGRLLWQDRALPKIHDYYREVLVDFSIADTSNTLHYLLKMLEQMRRLDEAAPHADADADVTSRARMTTKHHEPAKTAARRRVRRPQEIKA